MSLTIELQPFGVIRFSIERSPGLALHIYISGKNDIFSLSFSKNPRNLHHIVCSIYSKIRFPVSRSRPAWVICHQGNLGKSIGHRNLDRLSHQSQTCHHCLTAFKYSHNLHSYVYRPNHLFLCRRGNHQIVFSTHSIFSFHHSPPLRFIYHVIYDSWRLEQDVDCTAIRHITFRNLLTIWRIKLNAGITVNCNRKRHVFTESESG